MTKEPKRLEFLTTAEVAAKLDVTPTRVGQLVAEGELKVAAMVGDRVPLFAPEVVEKVKAARIAKLVQRVDRLRSS